MLRGWVYLRRSANKKMQIKIEILNTAMTTLRYISIGGVPEVAGNRAVCWESHDFEEQSAFPLAGGGDHLALSRASACL